MGVDSEYGAGWNESLCRYITLAPSDQFTRVSLPLPAGTIVLLRLILPVSKPATTARDARVLDSEGRILRQFVDSDLRADGRIALRTNLKLPTDPRRRGHVVRLERIAAILVGLAEGAILIAVWRRPKTTPFPTWLSRTVIGVAAAVILFSRRPDVFTAPQLWAEDGTIYFLGGTGGWPSLWESQGNYLAFLPRLTAVLSNFAPVFYAPILYETAAVAVCLAAVIKAASPRVGLPLPAFAGLAVVLVPNMDEITANITNAQWFGAVILVLVCISQPPTNLGQTARDVLALILFGLTGPFVIFAFPLLLWRAVRTYSKCAWMLTALGAVLVILQYRAYCASQSASMPGTIPSLPPFLAAFGFRTGGQFFALMRSPLFGNPIPWGLAGLVLYAPIWVSFPLRTVVGEIRPALAWMTVAIVSGGFLRYVDHVNLFFEQVFILRYFYLPLLFSTWLLLGGLATRGARRYLAAFALVAAVACNVPFYRMAPYVDLHWPHYASAIQRGQPIQVPINPPAWSFNFP